ncbi:MAG TPA: nucleoside hydrolase [Planctomycetota bacterium]|nr:nucleoside hydrolase [Planctomycetota bacterium]
MIRTVLALPLFLAACSSPVAIIFDTDLCSDCDDVAALAMLHALADLGEARIVATMASTRNPAAAPCIDAINTWYGRPGLPIGVPKGPGKFQPSKYAAELARRFPHRLDSPDAAPDAARLYRDLLLREADGSVAIVTVGYMTNLAELLRLPAEGGLPSGAEVVKRKVREWTCMGGNFIGAPARDDLKLGNVNFTRDAPAALEAIRNWPTPVMFVGREIGSEPSGLKVGARFRELKEPHPLRAAYELYFGGVAKDRHVADPTAVLYAVRGRRDYWDAETRGTMDLKPDMTFEWNYDRGAGQGYLLKRAPDRTIERVLEELMMRPPGKR